MEKKSMETVDTEKTENKDINTEATEKKDVNAETAENTDAITETSENTGAKTGIETAGSSDLGIKAYLLLVFVSTYLYEYFFVIRYLKNKPEYTIASISMRLAVAMFFPAACALAARYITGEKLSNTYINFNIKDGRYKYYLMAWFMPALLTLAGCLIYFIVFSGDYSSDMKYIIATYEKQGLKGITPQLMRGQVLSQAVTSILIGPIINCLTCFGEEWGWRGYLLPRLKDKLGTIQLMAVMGVVWGLWHAPLIIAGHNYGYDYFLYPFTGIVAMILFCFSFGTILSYVTLKTGSCIPAVIGHGAINSFSAIGIYFTKTGGHLLFGPVPTGVIAGLPCLVTAVILIYFMKKDEQK